MASAIVDKKGADTLLTIVTLDAFDLNKNLNALPTGSAVIGKVTISKIADLETAIDLLKSHYNIGREVTTAKAHHLKALETLIK